MQFDFDKPVDRRNTASLKWDACDALFKGTNLLPLWVADMDFPAPPAVLDALNARTSHGVYGYTQEPKPKELAPIADWTAIRHGHRMDPACISFAPGVVASLFAAVQAFTKPGDSVIIQPPVYPPFFGAVRQAGRQVVENPMRRIGDRYEMDLDHLARNISPSSKLFILCNPHNPGCRVSRPRAYKRPAAELSLYSRSCMLIRSISLFRLSFSRQAK